MVLLSTKVKKTGGIVLRVWGKGRGLFVVVVVPDLMALVITVPFTLQFYGLCALRQVFTKSSQSSSSKRYLWSTKLIFTGSIVFFVQQNPTWIVNFVIFAATWCNIGTSFPFHQDFLFSMHSCCSLHS